MVAAVSLVPQFSSPPAPAPTPGTTPSADGRQLFRANLIAVTTAPSPALIPKPAQALSKVQLPASATEAQTIAAPAPPAQPVRSIESPSDAPRPQMQSLPVVEKLPPPANDNAALSAGPVPTPKPSPPITAAVNHLVSLIDPALPKPKPNIATPIQQAATAQESSAAAAPGVAAPPTAVPSANRAVAPAPDATQTPAKATSPIPPQQAPTPQLATPTPAHQTATPMATSNSTQTPVPPKKADKPQRPTQALQTLQTSQTPAQPPISPPHPPVASGIAISAQPAAPQPVPPMPPRSAGTQTPPLVTASTGNAQPLVPNDPANSTRSLTPSPSAAAPTPFSASPEIAALKPGAPEDIKTAVVAQIPPTPSIPSFGPNLLSTPGLNPVVQHPSAPQLSSLPHTAALPGASTASDPQPASEPATLRATPNSLEVGLPTGSNGWLKVRAEVQGGGDIHATLSATSNAGSKLLTEQLPALNAFLHTQNIAATTTVAPKLFTHTEAQSFSNGSASTGGDQPASDPNQTSRNPAPSGSNPEGQTTAIDLHSTIDTLTHPALLANSGSWLNVLA